MKYRDNSPAVIVRATTAATFAKRLNTYRREAPHHKNANFAPISHYVRGELKGFILKDVYTHEIASNDVIDALV